MSRSNSPTEHVVTRAAMAQGIRMTWPAALALALSLAATGASATLYDDLGGPDKVSALVDRFLWNLADDERVNERFVESDLSRLRTKMIEHFCLVSSGPCEYTGDDMRRTHAGMGIDDAEFNVVVENLIEAMETLDIDTGVQNRLLKRLARFYPDIVE